MISPALFRKYAYFFPASGNENSQNYYHYYIIYFKHIMKLWFTNEVVEKSYVFVYDPQT